ncbi:MAG: DUF3943 domain-containing protein [Bacteroidales bacterium]|nr:DUF3943 domain-containing protein [Bacteroidales bacterium]MDD2612692.1 DUF3943 domain-containing protein [Bacteroidales bacterium]
MYIQKSILIFLFGFILLFSVNAQIDVSSDFFLNGEHSDSILNIPKSKLNAAGLIFTTNMSVWAFDRYITNGEYAHINLNTMKSNFKTGFVWDNDMFITNLFAHPYHGGLYFNAARSNGMNFWQSVPYTAGGSLMWEFFMENEHPAINDFLATTIGGASLGEMTYRLSDRIIDDRTFGFDRFKREALLTLISPARGLNRIINGDAWRHKLSRGNSIQDTPLSIYTAIGHRIIADNAKSSDKHDVSNMLCFDLGLNYGDPYNEENEKPYDYFIFKVGGNLFSKQPFIGRVNGIGMLYSKDINLKNPRRQLAVGLFQHFNYYESKADINHVTLSPYKLSEAASVGPGLLFKNRLIKHITFIASAYLSAILLGGSQTDHYNVEDRDYNMGSGFSSKLNMELQFGSKAILSMNSEDYRIYSWIGYDPNNPEDIHTSVQGDKGNASLSTARLNFSYIINKHFLVEIEGSYYYRKSVYTYYPDVEHGVTENKFGLGYYF